MLRGLNVDPLNQPPTPDELVTHRFNAVRIVMRAQGNLCESYGRACLARGIFVLGLETKASGGYMMSSVSAYQIGNEPDGFGVSSDVQSADQFVDEFNLFTDTYHDRTGKPFIAAGLCAGDYSAAFWTSVAPRLRNCAGLALHPYGKTITDTKRLISAHGAAAPGMPVWITEWNRPSAEIAGYDWWVRKNCAGGFYFCWGDWMTPGMGLVSVDGSIKPALSQFRAFNVDEPNTVTPTLPPPTLPLPTPAPARPAKPAIIERMIPPSSYGYGDSPGRRGLPVRFIVNHIADGYGSLFHWFSSQELSAHFWVGLDGTIEQYVPLDQAAYAQGLVTAGSNFPPEYPGNGPDLNRMAIAIEREGKPADQVPAAQWQAVVALNRWLAATYGVPVDADHITGHFRFDHINRARCPSSAVLNAPAYIAQLIADVRALDVAA